MADGDRDAVVEILKDDVVKKTYMVPDIDSEELADQLFWGMLCIPAALDKAMPPRRSGRRWRPCSVKEFKRSAPELLRKMQPAFGSWKRPVFPAPGGKRILRTVVRPIIVYTIL